METKGIKETLELLDGLKLIAGTVDEVLEDGKINLADLPKLLPLLTQVKVLVESVKGIDGVIGEVKDLDESEIVLLGGKVWEIIKEIKD